MSAALDTTERGPKNTRAKKPARGSTTAGLAHWKAKYNAEVDAAYAAAVDAAARFPALLARVEAWLPLRRIEADLAAVHTDMEERRCAFDDTRAAEELWQGACSTTFEAVEALLAHVTRDPNETAAKVAIFYAISDKPCPEAQDGFGRPNLLVQSLMKDVAAQVVTQPPEDRSAWNKAMDDYLAAVKRAGAEDTQEASDAEALAHETLMLTPAPDMAGVALKLSFATEFCKGAGYEVLNPNLARSLRERGNSWPDRCIAAAYLDALQLSPRPPEPPMCPTDGYVSNMLATLTEEDAAWAAWTPGDDLLGGPIAEACADRRDDIVTGVSHMQAVTLRGAAFQLVAAFSVAELVRGVGDQETRDAEHTKLERLLKSIARVLGAHIPARLWPAYIGGEHPGSDPAAEVNGFQFPDDVTLIALDRELEGLFPQINAINVEMSEKMDAAHARALEFAPHDDPRHHELRAQFEEEYGAIEASQRNDALLSRLGEIERTMRGLRATTLQGLRAKARVAAWWRDYDPDHDEVDSLLRDLAAIVKVPPNHLPEGEFNIRDLFEEYERLGGKITALEEPGGPAGRPWIGVRLAPTSTRSQELEALMTSDVLPTLHMLAVDAFGKQSWVSAEDAVRLAVPQEVFE